MNSITLMLVLFLAKQTIASNKIDIPSFCRQKNMRKIGEESRPFLFSATNKPDDIRSLLHMRCPEVIVNGSIQSKQNCLSYIDGLYKISATHNGVLRFVSKICHELESLKSKGRSNSNLTFAQQDREDIRRIMGGPGKDMVKLEIYDP